MIAAMDGVGSAAHVLEVVIAATADADGFAVAWAERTPGSALAIRGEGRFAVDAEALLACATPQEYGRLLGEALWRGEALGAWQRARARGRERLHVVLEVLAPELRTLRWERLCAPFDAAWDFLRCDQRTPFTLRVASRSDRAYAPPAEPRALLLVTSPSDLADYGMTSFDTLATIDGVRAALSPWPVDVLAFAVPRAVGAPTLEGLCEQLTARVYTAVHVVCHGAYTRSGETVLYLADDDETTAPAPADKLLRRLGRLGGEVGLPLLWFLAACETAAPQAEGALGGLAVRLCRELGAPAVVAMSEPVTIDTANELVRPFYRQLRAHGHVDLALAEACSAVTERRDLVAPVLHARAAGSPLLPPSGPSGHVPADTSIAAPVWSESPLPLTLGERFVGRQPLVDALIAGLAASPPPALALVAPGGLGKTRVALELVWQARARFPGGVWWFDASRPERREAVQHAALRRLRPDAPTLADLQQRGLAVADELAAATRAHRPGQAQLWVLDHLPEGDAAGPAAWCPRWGEVAVLMTSRMRPDVEGAQVIELAPLGEAEGAALLTAGLPAGGVPAEDAAAVVRWVGGMPLALELLARSLDLGDLSPADLIVQVRTGRVAQVLTETQQVLRTAGAGAGLSPLIDSLRLSYELLPAEARELARRLAQCGPEPLPTALVKALAPGASRAARAVLAARSFVTGISGQRFGSMHRVLADFLRGLCGPAERADACAALMGLMPFAALDEPTRWAELGALAVHAEALVLRAEDVTTALVELGHAVGLLYTAQARYAEAERVQRHVLALAEAHLPPESPFRVAAVNNLAITLSARGDTAAALRLQQALWRTVEALPGFDEHMALQLRTNVAVSLHCLGQLAAAREILAEVVARREQLGPPERPELLYAQTSLATAKAAVGDHHGARALYERVYMVWATRYGPTHPSTLAAAKGLVNSMRELGELAPARALLTPVLAAARALWSPEHVTLLDLRQLDAMLRSDEGEHAAARAEQADVLATLTRLFGAEHPRRLDAVAMFGRILARLGAEGEALALVEEGLALALARHGALHATTWSLLHRACELHEARGEHARVDELLAPAIAEMEARFPPDHSELQRLRVRRALALGRLQRFPEAEALLAEVAAGFPRRSADALRVGDRLATLRVWAGELAAARELQARVLADSRAALGEDHPDTLRRLANLGETLVWTQQPAEAVAPLQAAIAGLARTLGADHYETASARAALGLAYLLGGALAEAEEALAQALAGLRALVPADHGRLLRVQVALARVYQRLDRLDEAEAVLGPALAVLAPRHEGAFLEGAMAASELGVVLYSVGRAAGALTLLRTGVAMGAVAFSPDHPHVLANKLSLAIVLARGHGDRDGGLAVLDEIDASIARSGGAAHPLAELAASYRARLSAG